MVSNVDRRSPHPGPFVFPYVDRLLLWPFRRLRRALDRLDESQVRIRREAFGRRRLVLSWHRRPDGLWMARLSDPGVVSTVEHSARTRCRAIAQSDAALRRILKLRFQPGTSPDAHQAGPP